METPNEIWELIDSIMEDGELSESEVLELAKWLDEHAECRKVWPGKVLSAPVRAMSVSGKVTPMNLRRIGKLLSEVQKRRSKELISAEKSQSAESVTDAVEGFNPLVPLLPSIPISADVPCPKDPELVYEVDLSWPKCSCQTGGFTASLPRGHLNRCCEHVLAVYKMIRPLKGWPKWLDSYLMSSWHPSSETEWFVLPGPPAVLFSLGPNEWCDVYAPKRTLYDRFGFSRLDERWSYGERPKDAGKIEQALLGFIRPWEKTPQGKANLQRIWEKKAAKQAAKEAQTKAEQLDQITFLTKAGFSCDNLNDWELSLLYSRVLRPINTAIKQAFIKVEDIINTELRPLQFAILAWDHCVDLPAYGPYLSWDELLKQSPQTHRRLTVDERHTITQLASKSLPVDLFLSLQSNGVKRYKDEIDARFRASCP